jgi:hypothetical protein
MIIVQIASQNVYTPTSILRSFRRVSERDQATAGSGERASLSARFTQGNGRTAGGVVASPV